MWQYCNLSAAQRQTAPIADSILVSDRTDLSSVATKVICISLWLRKQRQRFAQDQPKGYFETKVFKLLLNYAKSIIPMKERWGRLPMVRYDKFNLPACGNIAIWQLRRAICGTVVVAWIWHVWINAMVFLPMAQAPPKADAKELLYCLPSKFDPWVYILFLDEGDFCRYG